MTQWLKIPPPPSVNALFANVAGKGRVRSGRYRQWATSAGWMLQSQRALWPTIAAGQPYSVALRLPVDYRSDIDNAAKGPIDLLVSLGIVPDDRLMVDLHVFKRGTAGGDAAIMASAAELGE
jgi:crossover junction endodeoxyribonuclease RusA